MSKISKTVVLPAMLALALYLPGVNAQNISSSILGLVTDASGAAVPEAQITVTNEGTGISLKTLADTSGAYSMPNRQAGTYTVAAAKPGFETSRGRPGVEVLAAQSVRINVQLNVGEMKQSVSVTGEAPLIKTDSPTIGSTITARVMADLPLAQQSIDTLLALVPGAQVNGSAPQTGGATHWGAFSFNINGVQANDNGNGGAAYSYNLGLVSLPAIQSMQEFKVEAFNTSAEYRTWVPSPW